MRDFDNMTDAEIAAYVPQSIRFEEEKKAALKAQKAKMNKEHAENATMIEAALGTWELAPLDLNNCAAVRERFALYLHTCIASGQKPHLPGTLNYLGITRGVFAKWLSGAEGKEHKDLAERIKMTMEQIWADLQMNGKTPPVAGIFLGKNWFGYKDQTDVVLDTEERRQRSAAELIAAAGEIPLDDIVSEQ